MSNLVPEESFRRLVERQGTALESHCRRMLGTRHDAEDAFQETLLRAWRGLPGCRGQSSQRAWLYRIATNVCIDTIARRPEPVLPIDHGPATESFPDPQIGDDAAPPATRYEQREALEHALMAALEHLPARQRSVLILREALGFSAREVALILETTVPATNSLLQRARATRDARLPQRGEQVTLRSLEDARTRDVVKRLVDAFEGGDIGTVVTLSAHG